MAVGDHSNTSIHTPEPSKAASDTASPGGSVGGGTLVVVADGPATAGGSFEVVEVTEVVEMASTTDVVSADPVSADRASVPPQPATMRTATAAALADLGTCLTIVEVYASRRCRALFDAGSPAPRLNE